MEFTRLCQKEDLLNVSSHDMWNVKSIIADDIGEFTNIKYAGKWRNNTRDLWEKYDDKLEYSKHLNLIYVLKIFLMMRMLPKRYLIVSGVITFPFMPVGEFTLDLKY